VPAAGTVPLAGCKIKTGKFLIQDSGFYDLEQQNEKDPACIINHTDCNVFEQLLNAKSSSIKKGDLFFLIGCQQESILPEVCQ
jgi:hypothetical protein